MDTYLSSHNLRAYLGDRNSMGDLHDAKLENQTHSSRLIIKLHLLLKEMQSFILRKRELEFFCSVSWKGYKNFLN